MAAEDRDIFESEIRVHDLKKAIEKVKLAHAERADVVIDMKNAKHSRLELLADDLVPVIEDIPSDNDMFEFALTNGEMPRLWIDMTSFVRMSADGRDFEFVKDTRLGRKILGRSSDRDSMGEMVTEYIAERILQRDRDIEGDWIEFKARKAANDAMPEPMDNTSIPANHNMPDKTVRAKGNGLRGFLIGIALLAAIVFGVIYFGDFQPLINLLKSS